MTSSSEAINIQTPVHHPFAAIDESLLVKIDKNPLHATGVILITFVKRNRPVTTRTQFFNCSMMMPPCFSFHSQMCSSNLSTQVIDLHQLYDQLSLDYTLCGNTG